MQEGTRSVQVRATLPNPENALRPGMFARVATLLPETRRHRYRSAHGHLL
ncbi:MAG: hypothetical protein U5L11_13725 [Arhodomonas sp.]|nr:hypothetical protein [Arhodomonas sp.]